jgi:hypothetical protein
MSIYIWKDNHQEGPFPESEILGRLSSGGLSGEDLAWTTGYDEWRPLSEILRLDSQPRNHPLAFPLEPMEIRSAASVDALTSKSFWKVLRENAITTTRLASPRARRGVRSSDGLILERQTIVLERRRLAAAHLQLCGSQQLLSKGAVSSFR